MSNHKLYSSSTSYKLHHYENNQAIGLNDVGANPVFGSVPFGLLNNKINGSGLWHS